MRNKADYLFIENLKLSIIDSINLECDKRSLKTSCSMDR